MTLSKAVAGVSLWLGVVLLSACGGGGSSTPSVSVPPVVVSAQNVADGVELVWSGGVAGENFDLLISSTNTTTKTIANVTSPKTVGVVSSVSVGDQGICVIDVNDVVCWDWINSPPTRRTFSHPIQVSVGLKSVACVLDDNGVSCWPLATVVTDHGQDQVPPLVNPTQISSGDGHSCALDEERVVCWGANSAGQTNVPPLTHPSQISSQGRHSCALDDTGVVCWGDDLNGQATVPALSNPTQISTGTVHSCALDDSGVVCWGDNSSGQTNVPILNNPRLVRAGWAETCALDDSGVVCWGNFLDQTRSTLQNPTDLSTGKPFCGWGDAGLACGIGFGLESIEFVPQGLAEYHLTPGQPTTFEWHQAAGLVATAQRTPLSIPVGFGAINHGTIAELNWTTVEGALGYTLYWNTAGNVTTQDASFTDITAPSFVHVGIDSNTPYYYRVLAHTDEETSLLSHELVLPLIPELSKVLSSDSLTLDWMAVGSERYTLYRKAAPFALIDGMRPADVSPPYTIRSGAVSLGGSHSCALNGEVVLCWGDDSAGQSSAPVLINPTQLSAGDSLSCAIDDTGVVCWGSGQGTSIPPLSNPVAISVGGDHACVLDDSGVVCWGDNTAGQISVPILVNPSQIGAGFQHSCVLDDTGVVCWGDNNVGQINVPSLINPTQLSVGVNHNCVVDNLNVVCWGDDSDLQSTVPTVPSLSNPKQVSAGGRHSCAIDDNGVTCWGNNDFGQIVTPFINEPLQLSAGNDHNCVLDGSDITCWGRNLFEQSVPPTGFYIYPYASGTTYYYVLEAFNSGGRAYSAELSVVVP